MKGEYILVYAKSENIIINFLPLSEDYLKTSYSEPNDMFPLGKWRPVTISISKGHQGS
jgi:adenine-specific DNA-methyltransferase